MIRRTSLSLTLFILALLTASAQKDRTATLYNSERNGWEYEVKAGINLGGASPLPLPEEIRSIENYNPKFNGVLEGVVTKWLGQEAQWGISAGLRVEEKGMKTGATVKNYGMEIINEGNRVAGYWTGYVQTKYNSTFLTLPLTADYRFNSSWKIRAGLYASLRLDGDFSGYVTDGYLRENSPIGQKIAFTDGKTATYDFTDNLRRWQWGAQIGGSWRAFKRFSVNADFTWAFNDIFKHDFKTITFNMYPIYLNIGFGYLF